MSAIHWPDCDRMKCTLDKNAPSEAEICRAKGWKVGTVVEGDEGHGVTRIRITAIGEHSILAATVPSRYADGRHVEHTWTFRCRCWREVSP